MLASWEHTPYIAGSQCKGKQGGVDCVRFVCGALDELRGFSPVATPHLPQDTAMHDRETALATMRTILRLYAPFVEVLDRVVQPADVLAVGPQGGGPGHAYIVGGRPNVLWHCTSSGVFWTGFSIPERVFGIYRLEGRAAWPISA